MRILAHTKSFLLFLDINEGDFVSLNENKAFVKSEFEKINLNWNDSMTSMLGNIFKVLPNLVTKDDPKIIALPSPVGSRDSQWYFPKTVVIKIGIE